MSAIVDFIILMVALGLCFGTGGVLLLRNGYRIAPTVLLAMSFALLVAAIVWALTLLALMAGGVL